MEEVFQRVGRIAELRVGGRTIHTTHEHPFYVDGKGWKQACALLPGDLLKNRGGHGTPVESICDTNADVPVYNMRIEEYHTYFVGCAEWGFDVWTHNTDYAPANNEKIIDQTTKSEDALKEALKNNNQKAIEEAEEQINGITNAQRARMQRQHKFKRNDVGWDEPLIPGINCPK